MPKFKRSAIQRGSAAIQDSVNRAASGGGNFRPFAPEIRWQGDGAERYVLFLTPTEETPRLDLHEWIEVGKGKKSNGEVYSKFAKFICREHPALGEPCKLCDLGDQPKDRFISAAVELEPVFEQQGERNKVVGFTVATSTYERRVKGDDDEEEYEQVTQPNVGMVIQAGSNFFGDLRAFNETKAAVEETPFLVKRNGDRRNVTYNFIDFEGKTIDLAPLREHLEAVSYLGEDLEDVQGFIDNAENDHEAALHIGNALLERYLDEMADNDRFEELTGPIDHIEQRFGKDNKQPQRRSTTPRRKEAPSESEKELSRSERFQRLRAQVNQD